MFCYVIFTAFVNYDLLNEYFLIEGLRNRDKVTFNLIFDYYYTGLCAFVNRYVNNPQAAEDIVQDLFVKLWHNSRELSIDSSLKSYLFTCVKNSALDFLKHEKVKKGYTASGSRSVTSILPEQLWEFSESELQLVLDQALEKLPPRTREIFTLSRLRGEKNQEIADRLGLSKRTIELQISNALKSLRTELAEYLTLLL